MHYNPACFSTFYQDPYCSLKFLIFCMLVIMTGKPTHTAKKNSYIIYCLKSEIPIMLHCQVCSTRYTAAQNMD